MKKYFLYQLKKNILPTALLAAFAIIMYVLPLAVEDFSFWNAQTNYVLINLYTEYLLIALGLMCAFVPVYILSYKMKKRSADMFYSLPLSKTKILAVHFTVGFLAVIAAYSAAYWLGFILVVTRVKRLQYIYYLWLYLASIIPAFIIYALSAFSFTRANTISDGIIFLILTHCALFMVASCLQLLLSEINFSYNHYVNPGAFMVSGPLSRVGDVFSYRISYPDYNGYSGWNFGASWSSSTVETYNMINDAVAFGLVALAAAGATVAMFLTEKNCKAENCGQVSESILGYRSLIPLYTVTAAAMYTLMADSYDIKVNIVGWVIVAALAYVLTVIYKRTLKIGKNALILLAASVGTGLILSLTLFATV